MRIFKLLTIAFFILMFVISCSEDNEDTNIEMEQNVLPTENAKPNISEQSFEISEYAVNNTIIGTIEADDPENDTLNFTMEFIEGLNLNPVTGILTVTKNASFLDYETNEEFVFEVSVSDGVNSTKTLITLIILNEEDGPLTNFEKDIINGFKVQILSNSTDYPLYKRSETAMIFISGEITQGLKAVLNKSIEEYNVLFKDGFKLEVTNDSTNANVQLFSSSIADMKTLWPDFGTVADENPGLGGIAEIGGGRIWIADYAQNLSTMKHELGHMIGLDHSPTNQCLGEYEENSIMCGGVNKAGENFNETDKKIIQYYYHPEIKNESNYEEVIEKLTELILADRE